MEQTPYFRKKLQDEFARRQRTNSLYSIAAFAKSLGLHSSELACILRGERNLPLKKSEKICDKLGLSPLERAQFITSLQLNRSALKSLALKGLDLNFKEIEENELGHKIISEWEHAALLTLFNLKNYKSDLGWMAAKLNISEARTKTVLDNLLKAGFVKKEKNNFISQQMHLKTSQDVQSRAIKQSHKESLQMALEKLDSVEMLRRDFSSLTFAMNEERIQEAKQLIIEFRKQMNALMEDGRGSEVYQLSVQLFPLTNQILGVSNEK